ncbi:unnamed protein product [Porites evermanni]|uniref:G-protein coupled receptors family 1 profile domain-containing protein n=1 Tax=Porites evermanni TaxID=104178 RepID=A0ABN8QHX8_9CNID|nr:unnamed protein product [Porites evermanni]
MSVVCIITTGLLYCKIYAALHEHKPDSRSAVPEQVAQNGDMANAARLRKTAVATFYMYILFSIFHIYSLSKKNINSCYAKLRRQRRRTEMSYVFSLTFFSLSLIFTLHWWPLAFLIFSPQLQKYHVVLMVSAEGLNLTLVFFNAFLSFTAIVLNIITMQALRKTPSLPKTLKTLLLSLAVSDLGVGLLVQPLYVAILVMEKNSTAYSTVELARSIQAKILVFVSHFGVFALAVDRFLAIQLHLRYQELVTHKRVVAVVISVWVFSASISYPSHPIMRAVIVVLCVITTGLL